MATNSQVKIHFANYLSKLLDKPESEWEDVPLPEEDSWLIFSNKPGTLTYFCHLITGRVQQGRDLHQNG